MDKQKEMAVANNTTEQTATVVQEAPQTQVMTAPAQPAVQQEHFFKRHWKEFVAGGVTLLMTVGSAIGAYKKGKANGIASVPMPQDCYEPKSPLDPNV